VPAYVDHDGLERLPYGEADTRAKLIDPALHERGWTEDHIRREETAGGIEIIEGEAHRASRGRVDYTLRLRISKTAQPLAVAYIEAKAENKPPTQGLEQVKGYQAAAKRLNVPFVYSTNGHLFVEYDHFTGHTSEPKPLSAFPSNDELRRRFEHHKGFDLESESARPLLIPYPGGEANRRYYQDATIRATFEKLARPGENRALLSLATGAGKTFIAVNLLKRIADAGQLKRALFVCDRDELRTQALAAFSNVFGSDVAEVFADADGKNNARNARIHVATYQTLDAQKNQGARNFFFKHYEDRNLFSHIIIDECHRSAWGEWKFFLEHNPDAVQIGLTATPRELKPAKRKLGEYKTDPLDADERILRDNIQHFGEPVYEYTLAQGIEDGYLAPPEIFTFDLFHDGKETPEREDRIEREELKSKKLTLSTTGQIAPVEAVEDSYGPTKLDERLMLPERVQALSRNFFEQLIAHGDTPEQKTILFCASDAHADAIAQELGNLYQAWCAANGKDAKAFFAFKCTAKSNGGDHVADLRGSASSHFIACTVELLTTGVDVPCLRNIGFMQYLRSPIVFYQMLGRGTRIDPDTEKLMFRVYDYTEATGLLGQGFLTQHRGSKKRRKQGPPPKPPISAEGVQIEIKDTGRYLTAVIDGQHRRITVEEYRERVAGRLVQAAADVLAFRTLWITPQERRALIDGLVRSGFSPKALQIAEEAEDCDLFDVLGEVGYGLNRLSRANRAFAFSYKQRDWLRAMPADTAATIRAITNQFARAGTEALESQYIFQTDEVRQAGGIPALKAFDDPTRLLVNTKERIFAA